MLEEEKLGTGTNQERRRERYGAHGSRKPASLQTNSRPGCLQLRAVSGVSPTKAFIQPIGSRASSAVPPAEGGVRD